MFVMDSAIMMMHEISFVLQVAALKLLSKMPASALNAVCFVQRTELSQLQNIFRLSLHVSRNATTIIMH